MRIKIFQLLSILAILGVTVMMALPVSAAVWTDQADYSPGSVVTISGDNSDGAGYIGNETVHVDVLGPNGYVSSFDSTADSNGAWSGQVTLPADESAVGNYSYTATGLTSGVTQSGTFTDSPKVGSVSVGSQTGTLYAGTAGSGNYTITIHRGSVSGSSGSFDADLSIITTLPTGATASFNPTTVHFTSSDTTKTSILTITTTSATPAGSTTFTVKAFKSTSDYATGNGTLTISKPSTTTMVTSSKNPSVYGDSVTFTATVSPSAATGTVQFKIDGANFGSAVTLSSGNATSGATSSLSASSHTVTAVYSGDASYGNSTGTLSGGQTVNKAHLTVTADNQSRAYGAANPTWTATITGFVNGEDSSVVSGAPSFSGNATTTTGSSAVGIYTITPGLGTLTATNYDFTTFNNGTLTITQAHTSMVVTVSPQIVVIGNSITLTATLSSSDSPSIVGGKTIAFTLNKNPLDGTSGPYSLGNSTTNGSGVASLSNSTSGWLSDVYEVTATYAGDSNIVGCDDDVPLVVADPGAAATGGGFIQDNGRLNFGFTVKLVEGTTNTYKGQFLLVNNGKWRVKGTLNTYATINNVGYASGSGTLYRWDSSVGLLGDWVLVQSGVSVTLTFADNGSGKKAAPDTFGVQIDYQFDSCPWPSLGNPNTAPLGLKGGNIDIKTANNTTDGNTTTPPPTGKGKNK